MSARIWLGRVGLSLAVFAVVLAGWLSTVHARAVAARDSVVRDVTALEQKVRELEVVAARLPEFDAEAARVAAEQVALERTLPAAADQQALARALGASARDLGLVVASLRWGAKGQREMLATAPFTVEVRGGPAAALTFAARVTAGEPLVAVRSVELSRGSPSVLRLEAEALALAGGR